MDVILIRDRMLSICTSLVKMLGSANWTVCEITNELEKQAKTHNGLTPIEPLSGYAIDYYSGEEKLEILLIPAAMNEKLIIFVKIGDSYKEYLMHPSYYDEEVHLKCVMLHEFVKQVVADWEMPKLILKGLEDAFIQIEAQEDSMTAEIGEYWFYFNSGDCIQDPEDYTKEELAFLIVEAASELDRTEYMYYFGILRERYALQQHV